MFFISKVKTIKPIILGIRQQIRVYSIVSSGQWNGNKSEMSKSVFYPAHRIALQHLDRIAIKDGSGSHTYRDVLHNAIKLSNIIKNVIGVGKSQERIGFLCPNDLSYVVTLWACWAAGHIGMKINCSIEFSFYLIVCALEIVSYTPEPFPSSSTFKLLY